MFFDFTTVRLRLFVIIHADEQKMALDACLNPKVELVALTGGAGTGKTLLALAAALAQERDYEQIILSRP